MRRRFSLILAVLAAVTMAMAMGSNCYIGDPPDGNPDCLFFCGD